MIKDEPAHDRIKIYSEVVKIVGPTTQLFGSNSLDPFKPLLPAPCLFKGLQMAQEPIQGAFHKLAFWFV